MMDSVYAMGKGSDRMLVLEVDEQEKRRQSCGRPFFYGKLKRMKTVSIRAAASDRCVDERVSPSRSDWEEADVT